MRATMHLVGYYRGSLGGMPGRVRAEASCHVRRALLQWSMREHVDVRAVRGQHPLPDAPVMFAL